MNFEAPVDHKVKFKESKKGDKYYDFVRELRNLRNMKVTVIPIVIGALGTVRKGLEREEVFENKRPNQDHPDNDIG